MSRLFSNVKIIEGAQHVDSGLIEISDSYLLIEPIRDMHEIEYWEDKLDRLKAKYVLAQVETELRDPDRYTRGYVLFVDKDTLKILFGKPDFKEYVQ